MGNTVDHPRFHKWDQLIPEHQSLIAVGWGLLPTDQKDMKAAGRLYDHLAPKDRWHVLCTLQHRDGAQAAEATRVDASADLQTQRAWDKLVGDVSAK
jgi:hypothetical protein